ncbi:MAG: tetratricopeptide repeat protein [Chitinophagaceae bacterium]
MTSSKLTFFALLMVCHVSCKEKQETVQSLVDKGADLVNEKKFEEGIVLYSKAIEQNPRVQLAYYNRGIAYSEIREYAKAIADFDKVILLKSNVLMRVDSDFNPTTEGQGEVDYGDVFYQRAIVESYQDSLQRSFNDFQRAIGNRYPDSSNCLVWQGVLLGRAGKHENACEYFEKARKAAQTVAQQKEAADMINKYCAGTKNIH